MPGALLRLRDASGRALETLLSEFFDGSDDALFNLADKAGSNQEQTAYFDAMRELRLRRKHMSLSILQWVSRAFNELGRFDPMPGSRGLNEVDQDSLTLMDHGELEQRVAIDNLISKLRNRHTEAIRLLATRVAHLVPDVKLAERQMPLSPEVICTGLGEACGDLDIDIRAKLVVLKLFDRLLINRLESLYQQANRLLVSEGVLPDLKRAPIGGKPEGQARRPVPPSAGQAGAVMSNHGGLTPPDSADASSVTFTELSALLHQEGAGSVYPQASGGQPLDTRNLMSRLGQLQQTVLPANGSSTQVVSLASLLQQALAAENGVRYSVQQVDNDVINLVTMLFDFILEDRQLPPLMKALIGRLQIPVLKVALCDRSFFNRGGHPARKLLNELAMAGIGWNEKPAGQRDPLREKIESVVERLVTEFTDNVDLFTELLKDFSHFMDLDRRRRELVEQRLKDAEEGRARQERAKVAVDSLLEQSLAQAEVPASVETLLLEPWRKYLQWVNLREGDDSELWNKAAELTRKLVWSVDPRPVEAGTRAELLRAIPGIVDELRAGLHSISWDPFAIDNAIRDLELTHVDVLQRLVAYREPTPEAPEANAVKPELKAPAEEVSLPEAADTPMPAPEATGSEAPAAAAESAETAEAPAAEIPPQWLAQADRLRVGSWIELQGQEQKIRCKLAAVIKATGKYIFVNRNGAKVAEYLRDDLASAMAAGEVALLDDGLIFDRALESIIDNLRHSRRD
ncbi:MAG: DUF1631 domain-containing protein [Marinobacter sp.]|uniref:DUF1631 domain-containing protein n=1 Tax=Marinobacter sp. TaxID=50741 RepID=UPI00299F1682|nr:DUF1631 domain-containing protein [Marinobacter sp.]MDX1635826.1 DUF1631 domain-containing protein [Marinobacter sp.]